MNTIWPHLGPARWILADALTATAAFSQPCLVHGGTERVGSVLTFAGAIEPRLKPVEAGKGIAVVLFAPTISDELRAQTAEALSALYRGAAATFPLTLTVFDGQAFTSSGPFAKPAA